LDLFGAESEWQAALVLEKGLGLELDFQRTLVCIEAKRVSLYRSNPIMGLLHYFFQLYVRKGIPLFPNEMGGLLTRFCSIAKLSEQDE
jgi:hypothetical protein